MFARLASGKVRETWVMAAEEWDLLAGVASAMAERETNGDRPAGTFREDPRQLELN